MSAGLGWGFTFGQSSQELFLLGFTDIKNMFNLTRDLE
jgi:hypothetical protein